MPRQEPMWQNLGEVSQQAYEWLYFDALNRDGKTHVSIDFLAPNPFDLRLLANPTLDARDRVGLIICISRQGDVNGIEIDFDADRAQLECAGDTLSIGQSSVTRSIGPAGLPAFELLVNCPADKNGRRISGKVRFDSIAPEWSIPGSQYYQARNDPTLYHRWVVHAPRAIATGHLTVDGGPEGRLEIDIDGHGYHDHNYGTVSLAATVQSWFWARGSDDERTVIAAHLIPKAAFLDDPWMKDVLYVGTKGRSIAGAVGDQAVPTLASTAQGKFQVPYSQLVSFEAENLRAEPVAASFAHKAMAIETPLGYIRRWVDLSLGGGRERPRTFLAVAEDIYFP